MTKRKLERLALLNETPAQRIRNEYLYLENNQRIGAVLKNLLEQSETADFPVRFGCECANAQCEGEIMMTTAQFDEAHAGEREFIICPGHEELDIEVVLERRPLHLKVRKHDLELAGV